jgi:hypothetical protein
MSGRPAITPSRGTTRLAGRRPSVRAGNRLLFRGRLFGGPKDNLSSAVGGALQHLVSETSLGQGEHFPDLDGEPARFNPLGY